MSIKRVVALDHTAQLGGAEIALQRLLAAVDRSWTVSALLFRDGPLRLALEQSGVPVDILELRDRTSSQSRLGLTDPRVLLRAGTDSMAFSNSLAERLNSMGAELVVANSLKSAVLAELATWRGSTPWVWHLHDRIAPDYLPSPVARGLKGLARRATHVVANSHEVARLTGLPPSRVTVAYPGLPDEAFSDVRNVPNPPVFGLLGRISSTKGQREFIEAAAILRAKHTDARFQIVGQALFTDQAYEQEVRLLSTQLGLDDRLQWSGWARDPRAALDGFTALVHASPTPEPFGQVIVEAMARRVPVIATLSGGVPEILGVAAGTLSQGTVLRTDRGYAVAPGDSAGLAAAMELVLENPESAGRMALQAFQVARKTFTISNTAATCTAAWARAVRQ